MMLRVLVLLRGVCVLLMPPEGCSGIFLASLCLLSYQLPGSYWID
jgi:hypothetical protein